MAGRGRWWSSGSLLVSGRRRRAGTGSGATLAPLLEYVGEPRRAAHASCDFASQLADGLAATGVVAWVERAMARRGRLSGGARLVFAYGAALGVCAVGAGLMVRSVAGLL